MKIKLDYFEIKENFDLNDLTKYGFSKPSPRQNIWWQKSLVVEWSNKGIGKIIESLNINKDTKEIYYYVEDVCNFKCMANELISTLLDNDVIEWKRGLI